MKDLKIDNPERYQILRRARPFNANKRNLQTWHASSWQKHAKDVGNEGRRIHYKMTPLL